jgi:hypothetical protein
MVDIMFTPDFPDSGGHSARARQKPALSARFKAEKPWYFNAGSLPFRRRTAKRGKARHAAQIIAS